MPPYLLDKRNELIWALADESQGYNATQIAQMFNLHRSTVHDIIKKKPDGWKPKWVKKD